MKHPIIVIEDSEEDFYTLQRTFQKAEITHPIQRFSNGDEALHYFLETTQATDSPALILLDLNLPGTDGRQLLQELKTNARWKITPVIVLSSSINPKDIQDCYQLGANVYMAKSLDLATFREQIQTLKRYWLDFAKLPQPYFAN
ncbi:Response regulator receiver domain-containing protein [Catalinimonas alkaloidigena]|uniref:Response regulator receiver domain-containing protein n=1 Tax=Catalinimonas alkaloidigena TaxID=1075417 RepID=A0A1G9K7A2_9BACT|nr:response regulator [Catalinimonas alkaloidigena]SDL45760.1 Response regulator receiver domain-containing protein [Catalinimonas alkaloidigena]